MRDFFVHWGAERDSAFRDLRSLQTRGRDRQAIAMRMGSVAPEAEVSIGHSETTRRSRKLGPGEREDVLEEVVLDPHLIGGSE